jgi:hypothetical protein
MTISESFSNINKQLIQENLLDLSLADYANRIIELKFFNIPFEVNFIRNYDELFLVDTFNLIHHGIIQDENEFKEYLKNQYILDVNYLIRNEEIFIGQDILKLMLIDSKKDEYIKWYLIIEEGYRTYRKSRVFNSTTLVDASMFEL